MSAIHHMRTVRGDTFTRVFTRVDANGNPVNITGWKFKFTLKENAADADDDATETEDWNTHTNAAGGITTLTISAARMAVLTPGAYFYDLQYEKPDGVIRTMMRGSLTIDKDITIRTG